MKRVLLVARCWALGMAALCGGLFLILGAIFFLGMDAYGLLAGAVCLLVGALAGWYAYRAFRALRQRGEAPAELSWPRALFLGGRDAGLGALAGFLAAIAYFVIVSAGLKSTEAQNRSNLNSLRSAVGLYYSDKEGRYPERLEALVPGGRYLAEVPSLWQGSPFYSPHWRSRAAVGYPSRTARDSGRWGYVDNPKDPAFGQVFIDCTHTDSRGARWDSY